jgi:hypothetical protein
MIANNEMEEGGKERMWPILRYIPSTSMGELRKGAKKTGNVRVT